MNIPFYVSILGSILLLRKIWSLDLYDRTHPYGLDDLKNRKYPDLVGEEYGVNVFSGKPSQTDLPKTSIAKIKWLLEKRVVAWRLSLAFGIIGSLLLVIALEIKEPKSILTTICIVSGILYFYTSYRGHHLDHYKNKYISDNLRNIKKNLKEDTSNLGDK